MRITSIFVLFDHSFKITTISSEKANFKVSLPSEFFFKNTVKTQGITNEGFTLLSHCGEKSSLPESPKVWEEIFQSQGLKLQAISSGCCSMAGAFGHEKEHLAASKRGFELSWKLKLEQNENVLTTGYSCYSQVKRFEGKSLKHPIDVLYEGLSS